MEEIGDTRWDGEFPLDHLTLHHYYGRSMSIAEAGEEKYDQFLVEAIEMEYQIERLAAAINAVATTRDIGVIIDEWGAWHIEAVVENGLEQPGTVIDALSAAAILDIFNQYSDVMTMSNIAQTVNVLQCLVETDGAETWTRPTYHVFDLYAPHKGNDALRTTVDTVSREVERTDHDLPLVSASASVAQDEEMYVTVMNLDCRDSHTVTVDIEGCDVAAGAIDAQVLFEGQAPDLEVDSSNAHEFTADTVDVDVDNDGLFLDLAPSTVAGISFRKSA